MSLHWKGPYENKRKEPLQALRLLRSGSRIFVGSGCSEPQVFMRTLAQLRWELSDVEIIQAFSLSKGFYSDAKFKDSFRLKSFYVGPSLRQAVSEGLADHTPVHIREVPHLFSEKRLPLHAALIQVSPPDPHGFCSLGVNVDIAKAAVHSAELVLAQVNPQMPYASGDTRIHCSRFDVLVEHAEPLLEYRLPAVSGTHVRIARRVASLVEDGSTIAGGLGPSAVQSIRGLSEKKNLGVHTDVFHEGFLDLLESGAVTNREKTLFPGISVAGSCIGTRRMFQYVHKNPFLEIHPTELVNDPAVIGCHNRMVSISPAVEVDLTGQISADSTGYRILSGSGGHVDFMLGAGLSEDGKYIVTLPSTYADGARSRIVPHLREGSGVTVPRSSAHYVVTEFGTANLKGLSIRERALALIGIAHPRFRRQLLADAKRLHYVYQDQEIPDVLHLLYPEQYETVQSFGKGVEIRFRPIKPTDERALQEFFYSLPKEDLRMRFFSPIKAFSHRDTQAMCNIDYLREMTLVGVLGESGSKRIVAVCRYIREADSDTAETDFTVRREYQGLGIAGFMIRYLVRIARENGVRGFAAYVLPENQGMLSVFCKAGFQIHPRLSEGVLELRMRFDEPADSCPFQR